MKLFNDIVFEARTKDNEISIPKLKAFIEAIMKSVPKEVKPLYNYLLTYGINNKQDIEYIMNGSTNDYKKLVKKYGITENEIKDIKKIIKKYCNSLKMLPMYLTDEQVKDVINKNKNYEDLTLDFDTEKGRNEVVYQFMPLVNKWVNFYLNKSGLTRSDLYSAALEGLATAMKNYWRADVKSIDDDKVEDKEGEKKASKMSFKNYASFVIQQHILHDIHYNSRDVRIPQSEYEKNVASGNASANYNTIKLSNFFGSSDDDDESSDDKLGILGIEGEDTFKPDAEKSFESLYNIIKNNFSERDCSVFFKSFGLNGYKKAKGFEIAKEFKMTPANVTIIVKRIIKFLKSDPKSKAILADLMDLYTESLLAGFIGKSKEYITEALINDELYMLLEEINKFSNKKYFKTVLINTLKDYDKASTEFLMDCFEKGFEFLDANYKPNKKLIIHFLEKMYPTEVFKGKSDVYCLEKMNDLINYWIS